MPSVVYVSAKGERSPLDVAVGNNLMMAAVFENVDGIEGMCGGCLACATCHVYVDEAWADRLPALTEDEDALLTQVVSERKANSRLCCQLVMTEALEGLTVVMPEAQ